MGFFIRARVIDLIVSDEEFLHMFHFYLRLRQAKADVLAFFSLSLLE